VTSLSWKLFAYVNQNSLRFYPVVSQPPSFIILLVFMLSPCLCCYTGLYVEANIEKKDLSDFIPSSKDTALSTNRTQKWTSTLNENVQAVFCVVFFFVAKNIKNSYEYVRSRHIVIVVQWWYVSWSNHLKSFSFTNVWLWGVWKYWILFLV
jgi:hypothetical protein